MCGHSGAVWDLPEMKGGDRLTSGVGSDITPKWIGRQKGKERLEPGWAHGGDPDPPHLSHLPSVWQAAPRKSEPPSSPAALPLTWALLGCLPSPQHPQLQPYRLRNKLADTTGGLSSTPG